MKNPRKSIILLTVLVMLFSACGNTAEETPVPLPTAKPEPTATATREPTPTPTSTPAPKPVFPIEILKDTEEQNDDDKRIYLTIETLNSAIYEEGTPGFNLSVDILKDTIEFRDFILQAAEEYPASDENHIRYGLTSMIEITSNGPEYLSLYVDYYTYTGGAHGNVIRTAYTYSEDGTRLSDFMDLVNAGVTLDDIDAEINRQIAKIIEDMGPAFYTDTISLEAFDPPPSFFIKDGVMVIYFQSYDIAPYAYGIPMFEMPPEIFSIK